MTLPSLPTLQELAIRSTSVKFKTLDIDLYEYLSSRSLDTLASSDRVGCSLLIPGANGFGNLFENICDRTGGRGGVFLLPGTPFKAFKIAQAVVRKRSSRQKPINIIAHSNGNINVVPFLVASLQAVAWTINQGHPIPIRVCRLDPIGIPKSIIIGAAQVVDIGSNKPDSRDPRDRAALSFLRPDFRARKGVGHSDLLNDLEILDRLVTPPYNFLF
jgi:hypothetical protein